MVSICDKGQHGRLGWRFKSRLPRRKVPTDLFSSHTDEQIVTGRLGGCLLKIWSGEESQVVGANTEDREKQVKGILHDGPPRT